MKRQLPIWAIVTSILSWVMIVLIETRHVRNGPAAFLVFLILAAQVTLWSRGLRNAGRSLPRFLLLGLLAWSLTEVVFTFTPTGVRDLKAGFRDGYQAGYPGSLAFPEAREQLRELTPQWAESSSSELIARVITWAIFLLLLDRIARHQERQEVQRLSIESLSRKAQELSLRAKLAPHFIFNTLNTLKAQIEQDPGAAAATTDKLAMLFRQILEVSDTERIPLRQELAFVEAYLGIEQARLGERLQVHIDVPEELESIEIPPLSLQVLVENAVKHGVAPLEAGGLVRISAKIQESHLVLEVDDPGDGYSTFQGTGTAISTLRQRLSDSSDLMWYPIPEGFRFAFRWPLNPELP